MSYKSKIPAIVAEANPRANRAIDQVGGLGQAVARGHARVDTGEMREGLKWDREKRELRGNAAHTIYNEFGTRHMTPQPMLAPAVEAMRAAVGVAFRWVFRP